MSNRKSYKLFEYVILYIIILSELSANDTCQKEESDEENENSDDDDDDDEYGIPAAELLRASSEEEDQMVEEEGKRVRKLFAGASARRVSRKMNKAMKKCQDGYFCEMKGRGDGKGGCQRKNTTGNYNSVAKIHSLLSQEYAPDREGTAPKSATIMATLSHVTARQ